MKLSKKPREAAFNYIFQRPYTMIFAIAVLIINQALIEFQIGIGWLFNYLIWMTIIFLGTLHFLNLNNAQYKSSIKYFPMFAMRATVIFIVPAFAGFIISDIVKIGFLLSFILVTIIITLSLSIFGIRLPGYVKEKLDNRYEKSKDRILERSIKDPSWFWIFKRLLFNSVNYWFLSAAIFLWFIMSYKGMSDRKILLFVDGIVPSYDTLLMYLSIFSIQYFAIAMGCYILCSAYSYQAKSRLEKKLQKELITLFENKELITLCENITKEQIAEAIFLTKPFPTASTAIGRTKQGGLPNLPSHIEWPCRCIAEPRLLPFSISEEQVPKDAYPINIPLHFIAQIDCTELPNIDPDFPTDGMIFIFANLDEEMNWTVDDHENEGNWKVIYVADAPSSTAQRDPPGYPMAVLDRKQERLLGQLWDTPLTGRLLKEWPLLPIKVPTLPDIDLLDENEILHKIRSEGKIPMEIEDKQLLRVFRETAHDLECRMTKKALKPHFLQLFEIANYFENSGRNRRYISWTHIHRSYPEIREYYLQETFPAFGAMLYHYASSLGDYALRKGRKEKNHKPDDRVFNNRKSLPASDEQYLHTVEQALDWMKRAQSIGMVTEVSAETRAEFRAWIIDCLNIDSSNQENQDTPAGPSEVFYILLNALRSLFVRAANDPKIWQQIDISFQSILADEFAPYEGFLLPEDTVKYYYANYHQILGHLYTFQSLKHANLEGKVNIFQFIMQYEYQISFIIDREDLKKRNFDKVKTYGDGT